MTRFGVVGLSTLTLVTLACSQAPEETSAPEPSSPKAEASLVVYTVNYPLQYFAERLGGDLVEVVLPAPTDVDPAYWSPDPETVAAYQRADLILLNGAGYAKWAERASLPQSKVVNSSGAIADRLLPLEEGVTHAHGPEGAHEHKGYAFTTWLDPLLAIEQARAVKEALARALPEQEELIGNNFDSLEADLLVLDADLELAFGALDAEPWVFSHPVYQYLAERYGLEGVSLHWEPGEMPSEEAWEELRELLADHPAKRILWEDAPLEETSRRLAELGLSSVVFEPCSNTPAEGDFGTVMVENVSRLQTTIAEQPAGEGS